MGAVKIDAIKLHCVCELLQCVDKNAVQMSVPGNKQSCPLVSVSVPRRGLHAVVTDASRATKTMKSVAV
jgi:hypothetical protein